MRQAAGMSACLALMATAAVFAGGNDVQPGSPGLYTTRIATADVDLVLNGAGIRNYLFFDIYRVALYLPQRQSDVRQVLDDELPRRVQITLLRDISAERDVDFLLAGLEDNNSAEELAAIQAPVEQFLNIIRRMGKVPKGHVVQLDYQPTVGTRVWLNRRLLGVVPGAAFNRSLLKIWLGENPIEKNLKRALLGEGPGLM
jgi:hypothetical protein